MFALRLFVLGSHFDFELDCSVVVVRDAHVADEAAVHSDGFAFVFGEGLLDLAVGLERWFVKILCHTDI